MGYLRSYCHTSLDHKMTPRNIAIQNTHNDTVSVFERALSAYCSWTIMITTQNQETDSHSRTFSVFEKQVSLKPRNTHLVRTINQVLDSQSLLWYIQIDSRCFYLIAIIHMDGYSLVCLRILPARVLSHRFLIRLSIESIHFLPIVIFSWLSFHWIL